MQSKVNFLFIAISGNYLGIFEGSHGNKRAAPEPTCLPTMITLKVLVATIDAQWEGMRDVGSARYEPALLPPCPTIRVLSYSN